MTIKQLQKEIEELKAKQAKMEAVIASMQPAMSMDEVDVVDRMLLREMAIRERNGDPSLRKAWNKAHSGKRV